MSTQPDADLPTGMTMTSCPSNNALNRELTEINMEINNELSENHLMPNIRPKRWLLQLFCSCKAVHKTANQYMWIFGTIFDTRIWLHQCSWGARAWNPIHSVRSKVLLLPIGLRVDFWHNLLSSNKGCVWSKPSFKKHAEECWKKYS